MGKSEKTKPMKNNFAFILEKLNQAKDIVKFLDMELALHACKHNEMDESYECYCRHPKGIGYRKNDFEEINDCVKCEYYAKKR